MRIAIVGSGTLSVKMLQPLVASRHQVVAAILDGRETRGLRRRLAPVFARYFRGAFSLSGRAHKFGIPTFYVDTMTPEELAPLAALDIDLILVGGFSIILKRPLLDLPRIGCVNTHSSLLPRHRGPNPFSAAILAGDSESGVTFHWMDEGIDSGAILAQHPIPLDGNATMLGLYRDACNLAGQKVVALMDQIEAGTAVATPQDESQANYEKRRQVADSWIEWSSSAEAIDRQVRGMSPQPYVRFRWRKHVILVHRVTIDPAPTDAAPGTVLANRPLVKVATGHGAVTLRVAFRQKPFPWIWPGFGSRPDLGEVLPSGPGDNASV
jgi:methionyl-tRNA formyltransferase